MAGVPIALAANGHSAWGHALLTQGDWGAYLPYCCTVVLLQLIALGIALRIMDVHGVTLRDIGLRLPAGACALGLIGLSVLGAAVTIGRDRLGFLRPIGMPMVDRLAFVAVSLVAGVSEELIYRGLAINFLHWNGASTATAVALSSAAFALCHLVMSASLLPFYFAIGLVFAAVYLWRGNLAAAIVAHAAYDLACILLVV